MYNILHLNKLIEWALPFEHKIYFNILNHPEYLNIRCLPAQLKNLAQERLQQYIHLPKVQGIIDYMWKEDWSDKLDAFYDYTDKLDKSRKQNLYDIVPELKR
jgi:hypothetical protein